MRLRRFLLALRESFDRFVERNVFRRRRRAELDIRLLDFNVRWQTSLVNTGGRRKTLRSTKRSNDSRSERRKRRSRIDRDRARRPEKSRFPLTPLQSSRITATNPVFTLTRAHDA
jgi:hypothetical protein